ncbi:MAG: hypothetical protein IT373_14350, partial [Polyangiaceae bacterium]|nr:hypothetical protein [Polyangiaceae bacterium]
TATRLAELMRHVGAVDSAQLDINYSYTRFFLVDRSREPPQLGYTFVPKLEYSNKLYLSRHATRDFFYVTER